VWHAEVGAPPCCVVIRADLQPGCNRDSQHIQDMTPVTAANTQLTHIHKCDGQRLSNGQERLLGCLQTLTERFSCSQPHMTTRPWSSRITFGAYSTSPKSNLKGPMALSRSNLP
jgi:hypothetical protein